MPPDATNVPPSERRRDYRAIRQFVNFYGRAFQQRELHNPCPIPPRGPALIAANHTAGLDPIAIQSACPRIITWVMTSDFYDVPSLKWFMEYAQMIRIERGGNDSGAWRSAMRVLGEGRVVGVFPEGRIETTDELLPFDPGIALLAVRGGADIFPVYLDGRQRNTPMLNTYLAPQSPSLAWGEPIRLSAVGKGRGRLETLTAKLRDEVDRLRLAHPASRRRGRSMLLP